MPRGPGWKVPQEVPKKKKNTPKTLFGALRARCPKALKKHSLGTFQPKPLGTPVNGGRDRNTLILFPGVLGLLGSPQPHKVKLWRGLATSGRGGSWGELLGKSSELLGNLWVAVAVELLGKLFVNPSSFFFRAQKHQKFRRKRGGVQKSMGNKFHGGLGC